MISTAPPPPKAGANGVRGGQGGSGDGCCDNVGSRARELIDRVPPCTSKYAFALHGKFYTGDCYIILYSIVENHDLKHQIYFWIGQESSLDKKACAAMHAVNLRNMLNAKTRTSRQGTDFYHMTIFLKQMFDSMLHKTFEKFFRFIPFITECYAIT